MTGNERKILFRTLIICLILGGAGFYYMYNIYDQKTKAQQLIEEGLERNIYDLKKNITKLEAGLKKTEYTLDSTLISFGLEREEWTLEIDSLELHRDHLFEIIEELKTDKSNLEELISNAADGPLSEDYIEEYMAEINRKDSILQDITSKNVSLVAKIGRLQSNERKAKAHVGEIVHALYEVYDVLFLIIRESDNLYRQSELIQSEADSFHLVDGVYSSLGLLWEDVAQTRERLVAAEEKISLYEDVAQDSLFAISKTNQSFQESIRKLLNELDARETRLKKSEELINTNYIDFVES